MSGSCKTQMMIYSKSSKNEVISLAFVYENEKWWLRVTGKEVIPR